MLLLTTCLNYLTKGHLYPPPEGRGFTCHLGNDDDYATRWMLIKQGFSRRIPKIERISKSRKSKGERGIWQRRYWEHVIRDQDDYQQHINYIHYNPVKHGYVEKAIDWQYSTLHQTIQKGIIHPNWGYVEENHLNNEAYGERQ